MPETNWAGNLTYSARAIYRPTSVEELQETISRAGRVHVVGARHSFNAIADSTEMISLDELPLRPALDMDSGNVACSGATRYGELARFLDGHGLALHNLASLPHISVAGAIATATHGSGNANGNLATAVVEVELVTSSGDVRTFRRGDPEFAGVVVGLGALGAVTRVRLQVQPSYQVRQRVYEHLTWDSLLDHFDDIMSAGDSVSVFTDWSANGAHVWVKTRVTDTPETFEPELFGAIAATVERNPIVGADPVNCTPQLGRPGAWWDRLPHFRVDFKPSSGHELQSEYLMPRRHALAALEAVRQLADRVQPLLQMSEIRTIVADNLWLSPQYGQDTVGIHFTWWPDLAGVQSLLVDLESALAPFSARPHWGKLFTTPGDEIAALYQRLPDFLRLREQLDPREALRNTWFQAHISAG